MTKPIVVEEGKNVRLRCAAEGRPKPSIEWKKVDGSTITSGSWEGELFHVHINKKKIAENKGFVNNKLKFCCCFFLVLSVSGHTLNIHKISRQHMGAYMCIADNGIPPAANQTFVLEVQCKLKKTQKHLIFFQRLSIRFSENSKPGKSVSKNFKNIR